MALINCPECNKEVSDKADACPNCAFPITKKETKPKSQKEPSQTIIVQNQEGFYLRMMNVTTKLGCVISLVFLGIFVLALIIIGMMGLKSCNTTNNLSQEELTEIEHLADSINNETQEDNPVVLFESESKSDNNVSSVSESESFLIGEWNGTMGKYNLTLRLDGIYNKSLTGYCEIDGEMKSITGDFSQNEDESYSIYINQQEDKGLYNKLSADYKLLVEQFQLEYSLYTEQVDGGLLSKDEASKQELALNKKKKKIEEKEKELKALEVKSGKIEYDLTTEVDEAGMHIKGFGESNGNKWKVDLVKSENVK